MNDGSNRCIMAFIVAQPQHVCSDRENLSSATSLLLFDPVMFGYNRILDRLLVATLKAACCLFITEHSDVAAVVMELPVWLW